MIRRFGSFRREKNNFCFVSFLKEKLKKNKKFEQKRVFSIENPWINFNKKSKRGVRIGKMIKNLKMNGFPELIIGKSGFHLQF